MDRPVRVALVAVAVFLVGGAALAGAGLLSIPFLGDCPTGPSESTPRPAADASGAATTTGATATTAEATEATTTVEATEATTTAEATATTAEATATEATATTATTAGDGYARTTVIAYGDDGRRLGTVRVRIAESYQQKYLGLSDTDSLPEDEGMLFPYESEGEHTYVMRGMSFGIDIVYVDAEGYVTRIHHAPEPPEGVDGNDCRYPGRGQYVLEVNYNWTVRHGVDVGDRLYIEGYEEWPRDASDGAAGDDAGAGALAPAAPLSAGLALPAGEVRLPAQR